MPTRELSNHIVNPANDRVRVIAMDEPGSGGANHHYRIIYKVGPNQDTETAVDIVFQNGPINVVGVNGLTHEALLAIIEDRLVGFQKGQYATRENALALTKLQECMHWLHARTLERMRRGVEGTHAK